MNLSRNTTCDSLNLIRTRDFRTVSFVCYPILLTLCTAGNILNITVFLKQRFLHSKEILILSLAVSDLLLMWFRVPKYLEGHCDLLHIPLTGFLLDKYNVFEFLQETFYYTSDSILVLFSLERLIVFRHRSFHLKWRDQITETVTLVIIVWLICGTMNILILVEGYSWRQRENLDQYTPPKWLEEWKVVHTHFEIIFPLLVVLTLLVINTLLVRHIKQGIANGNQLRRHMFSSDSSYSASSAATHNFGDGIYAILLGCVVLYFVTQLPSITINTLGAFPFFEHYSAQISFLKPIVSTISLINYSMNFAVYSLMSQKYLAIAKETCHSKYRQPGHDHR